MDILGNFQDALAQFFSITDWQYNLQVWLTQMSQLLIFTNPAICESPTYCLSKDIVVIFNWSILLVALFYGFMSLVGIVSHMRKTTRDYVAPISNKFLIIIPAHNEAAVIGHTVENFIMKNENYNGAYDVYVLADNCTDETAKIALEKGAKVFENTTPANEPKGKPHVIKKFLAWMNQEDLMKNYDFVCFIDADNLVEKDYLLKINTELELNKDIKIVQTYLDAKNPNDSLVAMGYASAYYCSNVFFQNPKTMLGFSADIMGTSFFIKTTLLNEIGWNATSLTEDIEFQITALLKSNKTYFTMVTKAYDEKPIDWKTSFVQRVRWSRGHWTVFFDKILSLLASFVTKKPHKRRITLESIIVITGPLRTCILWIIWIYSIYYSTQFTIRINFFGWIIILIAAILVPLFFIWIALKYAGAKRIKKPLIYVYLANILYILSFMPIHVWGLLTWKKTTWVRTEHNNNDEV